MAQQAARPPASPPRVRLILLVALVSLVSLCVGILVPPWGEAAWPWLLALAGVNLAAFAFLHLRAGRPDRRDPELLRLVERESEERVNRAREHLRLTMRAARIGTLDWDIAADRLTWSDNVPDILGVALPAGGMSIAGFYDLIVPEDRDAVRRAVEGALGAPGGERDGMDFRVRGGGQERHLEARGRIFRDEQGVPLHMLGTVMDVTERRQAAEALRQARDAAESANRAKSDFLANLSHEIRTPLGAIVGMVELMQSGAAGEEQRGQLRTLATAAETLLSLITDVLDISKIEAGKLELEAIPFDPRELVRQAAGVLALPAQRKGLALDVLLDDELPPRVVGDPGRLRQVLLNLVGNAVKFTSAGEVTIRVRPDRVIEEGDGSAVTLSFEVRDTGIGIPEERQRTIFEPFAQAAPSTARTHGGTGLGLTISARLVERMGGRIEVHSEPGRGSTFSFALAFAVAEAKEARPVVSAEPAEEGPGQRVLLVEDNPVNQHVLTMLLERGGHRVVVAANGREALATLERESFDLVLMDVQMPEMDGLRCTKLIRQREKATGGRVPIVAVTANALQGERQRCLQAGMDEYLAKPVRGHELAGVMTKLLGRRARANGGGVAVAEDEPAWLASLREMGFDEEGMARLTRTFVETVPERMEVLRRAVAARDADAVNRTAHTLKGSLAVFGAAEALDAAARLMVLSAQNQPDGYAAALADLEAEVGPLLGSMRQAMA